VANFHLRHVFYTIKAAFKSVFKRAKLALN